MIDIVIVGILVISVFGAVALLARSMIRRVERSIRKRRIFAELVAGRIFARASKFIYENDISDQHLESLVWLLVQSFNDGIAHDARQLIYRRINTPTREAVQLCRIPKCKFDKDHDGACSHILTRQDREPFATCKINDDCIRISHHDGHCHLQ